MNKELEKKKEKVKRRPYDSAKMVAVCGIFGGLALMLYLSSGSLIRDVFMYGIFTSLGQVVIFIFLEKFGPLTLSMITSIRKVITIAVSIILFGKTILPHQFVSLIFAGVVIVWEMVDKKDKGKKDKKV